MTITYKSQGLLVCDQNELLSKQVLESFLKREDNGQGFSLHSAIIALKLEKGFGNGPFRSIWEVVK